MQQSRTSPGGPYEYTWDGSTTQGPSAPKGIYPFEIEVAQPSTNVQDRKISAFLTISGVSAQIIGSDEQTNEAIVKISYTLSDTKNRPASTCKVVAYDTNLTKIKEASAPTALGQQSVNIKLKGGKYYFVVLATDSNAPDEKAHRNKPALEKGVKDRTVISLEITDPVDDPANPTDNNFTFNAAAPGVCDVPCTAQATPDEYTDDIEPWSITEIVGSNLSTIPDPAKGGNVTFRYTTLPASNEQFGDKTVTAKLTITAETVQDTVRVQIFFNRDATNNPGGADPNWYYYWSQTGASSGNHHYDPNEPQLFGYYQGGDDHFHICEGACGFNDETGHDGIDTFAETCIHEGLHQTHWEDWHGLPDADGDWLPDFIEDANGNGIYDPPNDPSDWQNAHTFHPIIDDEDWLCYQAEHNWVVGSADQEDWANPGHQTNL